MNSVTFVVASKSSPDGSCPFTILRMTECQQDVVSFHKTVDEATDAARRYASTAHFSGLDARIFVRDWLLSTC